MKTLLAASAMALAAGAADAAVYDFSFVQTGCVTVNCGILGAGFTVDLPSLINQSFNVMWSDSTELPAPLLSEPFPTAVNAGAQVSLTTDEYGQIVEIFGSLDDAGYTHYFDIDLVGYYINLEWDSDVIASGYWTAKEVDAPAPVPLPASALLMLTGLAGFGAMRLRRR
ncbi:VPLPA-CTERM sorting domain-containing protein [Falsirhodobacter xinxiangensis]|uniref:VPLPA-CTERM sorting domain-containing protein n=1 Tax=Falsirhodobacter xinxiangensis TaxID=2530049 RepID=UPI00145C0DD6|nr:VPLPA-CTERM sorting domain-containing protein [Rhodobacter xinxiangensis]